MIRGKALTSIVGGSVLLALVWLPGPETFGEESRLVLGGAGKREGLSSTPFRTKRDHEIRWRTWTDEAFQHAKAEDKLILLDLTAVWCHWCHVMDETSYSDPEIIEILNTEFIPIRVDADRHPEIQVRYLSGGWPTTDILLWSGGIVFGATYLRPEELKSALRQYRQLYREHKEDILKQAVAMQERMKAAWNSAPTPEGAIDPAVLTRVVNLIKGRFDKKNGGFGGAPKFFEPDTVTFALLMHYRTGDESLKDIALTTLTKQLGVYDPVWGGFFRYSVDAEWTTPHYEKMLEIQAAAIHNYLHAYQLTGERRYRAVVEGIIAYVNRFLSNQARGGFFGSQDADVGSHDPKAEFMDGEDYYALGERDRLKIGIPYVDMGMYTNWNGMMIVGYLKAYQVLGDTQARDFALQTLDLLYRTRYREGNGVAHYFAHGEPQGFGLLADQVAFTQALLEAYVTTADRGYLEKAEKLAADLQTLLEDGSGGGFFDMPFDPSARGMLLNPQKPAMDNARAALLFSDLSYFTENAAYKSAAERTLRFLLGSPGPYPPTLTALAVDRFLTYPLHIVVVGEKEREETRRLWQESLRLYSPGKAVIALDPTKDALSIGEISFPRLEKPVAYVCTDKLCSTPIENANHLRDQLEQFVKATLSLGAGDQPSAKGT